MKDQLSITERDKLRCDILRGAVDRDAFKALGLHPADEMLLEMWLPRPRTTALAGSQTPERVAQIAEAVRTKMTPEPRDAIAFLRNADESRIAPLLNTEDLNTILKWRKT